MSILNIKPETYERLVRKAAERHTTVDKLVEPVLEQLAGGEAAPEASRQLSALESFIEGMTTWTAANLPPGHVVDDSRERIYEGRGE